MPPHVAVQDGMKNVEEYIMASDAIERRQAMDALAVGDGNGGWNENAHIAHNDAVFFMKVSCGTMGDKMEWE